MSFTLAPRITRDVGSTAAALTAVGAAERSRVYEDVGGGAESIPQWSPWLFQYSFIV